MLRGFSRFYHFQKKRKFLIILIIVFLILFALLLFRIIRNRKTFKNCPKIKGGSGVFVQCLGIGQPCANLPTGVYNFEILNKLARKSINNEFLYLLLFGEVYTINGQPTGAKCVFVIFFNVLNEKIFEDYNINYIIKNIPQFNSIMLKNRGRQRVRYIDFLKREFIPIKQEDTEKYLHKSGMELNNFLNIISENSDLSNLYKEPFLSSAKNIKRGLKIIKSPILVNYETYIKNYINFLINEPIRLSEKLTEENYIFKRFILNNSAFPIMENAGDNSKIGNTYAYIREKYNINGEIFENSEIIFKTLTALNFKERQFLKIDIVAQSKKPLNIDRDPTDLRIFWQHIISCNFVKIPLIRNSAFYLSNSAGLIPYKNTDRKTDVARADIFPNTTAKKMITVLAIENNRDNWFF